MKQVKYLWGSHWIIPSRDSFKKRKEIRFKNADSFSNETSFYEWVIESFIQDIRSKMLIHSVMKVILNVSRIM